MAAPLARWRIQSAGLSGGAWAEVEPTARDFIAVKRDVATDSFILAVSDELPAMLSVAANDDRSVGFRL